MKSKIIINTFIIYFLILLLVLFSQIKSKDIVANEPISSEIAVEDKIKNSTILFVDSPFYIKNNRQSIIDNNLTITPIIYDSKVYIPVRFIATAYNATINFSKTTKDLTIRLNNKAIIFYNNDKKIKIVDNISEETREIDAAPLIIDDRMYIPLRTFAQAFDEKEVFFYDGLIVISNINEIFDPMEEIELISNISEQVRTLPTLNSKNKLIEILNSKSFIETPNLFPSKTINQNIETSEFFVKQIEETNFYFANNILYAYKNDKLSAEIDLNTLEDTTFDLNSLDIFDNTLVFTYSSKNLEEEPYFYVSTYTESSSKTHKISGNFEKISFSKKIISIVSTQDVNTENNSYPTPTLNFETSQRANYTDITYFPELNGNFFTIVTNISLPNNDYLFNKVFFGAGKNIFFNNNYLYFVTKKDIYSFIHAFKINDNTLSYIKRIYLKGEITNFTFDTEENTLKITSSYENENYNNLLTSNLEILD